ncbi:hypothetical protein E6C27_scaffold60G002010 [Cucumis melo var. makuwa]|uniref:Uncharacterized protein n=1 Tax=Cucumis melo var. makuwa TaxID=1194695 RepID=A0A5A7U7Q4_CUCMM|nr:hypothetical protein E6C27_scaffold60G002010 [Cucumis melo var. makuwa]
MVNAYKEEFGDKLHLGGITSIICVLKGEQVWGTTTTLQHPKFHTPSSSPSEPLSFVDTSSPSQVLTLTDGMLLRLFADLISKRFHTLKLSRGKVKGLDRLEKAAKRFRLNLSVALM